jgi:MFS family permease
MAQPDRPTLSSFWHDLPREGKLLLSTVIVDFIGNGLVMPFHVVYLHEVRGFELARVGLLLSLPALVGLLVVGPIGALIDRIGARVVVISALLLQIAANLLMAVSDTELRAALACILLGFSGGVIWPAINTLIATLIPSHLRQRYYGVSFTLLNLGIGIGGILGGFFVDVARPGTFTAVYLIDAATYLAPLAIYLGPLRRLPPRPAPEEDRQQGEIAGNNTPSRSGYRVVLRDRSLRLILLLVFVASFVGYGQLNTGLPAFGRVEGGISTRTLGWAFAANTAVIVVLQLFVLQRIEGRRRTRLLVLMSAIWAMSFLALGATGLVPGTVVAALLFCACFGLFGFGETFYQPTLPAMVNDLAPDHLRGRYNALMSIAWQSASFVGPAVAGVLIGGGWGGAYIGVLVAGLVLVALIALATERSLPALVNGVRAPTRQSDGEATPDSAAPVSGQL